MNWFEQCIKDNSVIKPGNIIKVDSFLNHQLDIAILDRLAQEFYEYFKKKPITKILTIEASGIALSCSVARLFQVPVLFAKKAVSLNIDPQTYQSTVYSFTKKVTSQVVVAKQYLDASDQILIIDDFLAEGAALGGLIDLVNQANATVVGIGIAIEKGFQKGGSLIRQQGYDLKSLAIIDNLDAQQIHFRNEVSS